MEKFCGEERKGFACGCVQTEGARGGAAKQKVCAGWMIGERARNPRQGAVVVLWVPSVSVWKTRA